MTESRGTSRPNGQATPGTERDVSFLSAAGDVTLAGTLTTPAAGRQTPAVVLVAGTGPTDRDVTFCGHGLFMVLADALAGAGIASLRFDKRGIGQSQGHFAAAGPGEFAADVRGAAACLVDQEGFSFDRIGLIGHSEGGLVALAAAAEMPRLAFCVLLASPLLSGKENLVLAFSLLARGALERDEMFERYVADMTHLLEGARSSASPEDDHRLREIADAMAPRLVNERTKVMFGDSSMSGIDFLTMLSSPCLETCLTWDPARIVPLVDCPALLVYGTQDVQVPALENLAAARALLQRFDKPDWAVLEFAGMNHLFQNCRTGMPDEYGAIDQVMDDEVTGEVANWINTARRQY